MTGKNKEDLTLEKLYKLNLAPNVESHIKVVNDICRTCFTKDCTKFCPTDVFFWSETDEKLVVLYESCIECGACKIGCPFANIKYENPKSGFGMGP